MLETEWANSNTDGILAEIGVTIDVPTPAADAPISTILSRYFSAGILPLNTS